MMRGGGLALALLAGMLAGCNNRLAQIGNHAAAASEVPGWTCSRFALYWEDASTVAGPSLAVFSGCGRLYGGQVALVGMVSEQGGGLHLSPIFAQAERFVGVQGAAVNLTPGGGAGVLLGGVNLTGDRFDGAHLGVLNLARRGAESNPGDLVQLGVANFAPTEAYQGFQAGVLNAGSPRWFQVGLINFGRSPVQVGLLNWNGHFFVPLVNLLLRAL